MDFVELEPIPVAARCKSWLRRSSLAGTAGSNPFGDIEVFLSRVLCVVR
jgi:hypothetical protein